MAAAWRKHIVHELQRRDRNQSASFSQLFMRYYWLLDRTSATWTSGTSLRRSSTQSSVCVHQRELQRDTGELAFQAVELQHQLHLKNCVLDELQDRLSQQERDLQGAVASRSALRGQVEAVQRENTALKSDYDLLLWRQQELELQLRQEVQRESRLLEQLIQSKREEARRMNNHNRRKSRTCEVKLQKQQSAMRLKVSADSCSAPSSRSTSPQNQTQTDPEPPGPRIRSTSASSPRILSSLRGFFQKRRGHSVCSSLDQDLFRPVLLCVSVRVPSRPLHVLEAHEEGVNSVRFSSAAETLATAGTDRFLKLWDVSNGSLSLGATLFGFTETVTCIDLDRTGSRILAASYDKSAFLWQLDDPVPKLTLTGHRRKVCASRFCSATPLVVTGSADGSIRLWDVQREACVQVVEVGSHCSDVVCSENTVISGHFDSRIRLWDLRTVSCIQELEAVDKVTSLDLSPDHHQLLSCCRDDALHLFDLRGRSSQHTCFRAEGFTCGSDSNKAVISPDSCFVAGGSSDGAVYVWNISNKDLQTRLQDQHSSSVSSVSWSASGRYFVSVDTSRRAVLWSDF